MVIFNAVAHHIVTGLKVAVKILNKGKIKHMGRHSYIEQRVILIP
jgi:hypothetical protein